MKCKCGAEIRSGANYCGKCGRPVLFSEPATSRCKKCGSFFSGTGLICDTCKTKNKSGTILEKINDQIGSASIWVETRIIDKMRAKKILIIALVVGLCIAFVGLAGRIVFGILSYNIDKMEILRGTEFELSDLINRSARNLVMNIFISIIKNDSSGFINMVNQIMRVSASMAGDLYGINGFLPTAISPYTRDLFTQIRAQFIQNAGAYWPLLVVMAYYRELLTVGLIIAVVAAVLWYLLGGKPEDVKTLKLMPALYIGGGWIVLVIIIALIGVSALI